MLYRYSDSVQFSWVWVCGRSCCLVVHVQLCLKFVLAVGRVYANRIVALFRFWEIVLDGRHLI